MQKILSFLFVIFLVSCSQNLSASTNMPSPIVTLTPEQTKTPTVLPIVTPAEIPLPTSCFDVIDPAIAAFQSLDFQGRTLDDVYTSANLATAKHGFWEPVYPGPHFFDIDSLVVGTGVTSLDYQGNKKVKSLCLVTKGPYNKIYSSPVGIDLNGKIVLFTKFSGMSERQFTSLADFQDFLKPIIGKLVHTQFVIYWPDNSQFGYGVDNPITFQNGHIYDASVRNGMIAKGIFENNSYVAYCTNFATTKNTLHVYGADLGPLMTQKTAKDFVNQPGDWLTVVKLEDSLFD